jgi:hypothetical protein
MKHRTTNAVESRHTQQLQENSANKLREKKESVFNYKLYCVYVYGASPCVYI